MSALALGALGATEEPRQAGAVRQDHLGAIDRPDSPASLPAQRCVEALFVSSNQPIPQRLPEPQGQPAPRLAEGFFGNALQGQTRAQRLHLSPGLGHALGHGGGVQADVHHEPGDDLRDQRPMALRGAVRMARHRRKLLGRQEGAKWCEPEFLDERYSITTSGTDSTHRRASLYLSTGVVLHDHSLQPQHRQREAFFIE